MGVEITLAKRASFFSLLETLLKETFKTEIEVKKTDSSSSCFPNITFPTRY